MPDIATIKPKVKRLTFRQRRLRQILLENKGSTREAMIKAGYSPAYANNPQDLTSGQRWIAMLEKDLPDSLLTKVAQEGLKARKTIRRSDGSVVSVEKDMDMRHKYLDTALKMKGKLVDRTDITTTGQAITGFNFIAPSSPVEAVEAEIVDKPQD
jgi:hypothetical protein